MFFFSVFSHSTGFTRQTTVQADTSVKSFFFKEVSKNMVFIYFRNRKYHLCTIYL